MSNKGPILLLLFKSRMRYRLIITVTRHKHLELDPNIQKFV